MKILAPLFLLAIGCFSSWAMTPQPIVMEKITPAEKLRSYISADFKNRGRVEVERVFLKEIIPQEAMVMAVEPRPALGLINFEMAWQENRTTRHAFGTASVKLYAAVMVAKTVIQNNEAFTNENCGLQEREVSPFRITGFYDRMESLKTFRARGYINPGTVIAFNQTQAPYLVNSGEMIELVRETPTLRVAVRVKALEQGRENQWIRIENINTKKISQAKVIKSGEVSLH